MSDAASDRPGVTGWVTRLRSKEVKTARSHKRGGFWSLSEWIMGIGVLQARHPDM